MPSEPEPSYLFILTMVDLPLDSRCEQPRDSGTIKLSKSLVSIQILQLRTLSHLMQPLLSPFQNLMIICCCTNTVHGRQLRFLTSSVHSLYFPSQMAPHMHRQPVAAANVNFLVRDIQNDRLFLIVTIWIVCTRHCGYMFANF